MALLHPKIVAFALCVYKILNKFMRSLKLIGWLRDYTPCFCPKIDYAVQKYHPLDSFEIHINPGIIPADCLFKSHINPLNAELNPICHLLTLFGAHRIFHVSRLRVNGHYPTVYASFFHGLSSFLVFRLRGLCTGFMATYDTADF